MGADRLPDDGGGIDPAGNGGQPDNASRMDAADGLPDDRPSAQRLDEHARTAGADVASAEPRGREEYGNAIRTDGAISLSADHPGEDEPRQPTLSPEAEAETEATEGAAALADDPVERTDANDRRAVTGADGVAESEDLVAAPADPPAMPESGGHIPGDGQERLPGDGNGEASSAADEPSEDKAADSQHAGGPSGESGPDVPPVSQQETTELRDPAQQGLSEVTETASISPDASGDNVGYDDSPPPLTDLEWVEHVTTVCDRLWERALCRSDHRLPPYTIDPAHKIWSEERGLLHDSIINDIYAKAANVPCELKAIITGGLEAQVRLLF